MRGLTALALGIFVIITNAAPAASQSGPAGQPEIEVKYKTIGTSRGNVLSVRTVPDGTRVINSRLGTRFQSATVGSTASLRIFEIHNKGTATLRLTGGHDLVEISGGRGAFTVTDQPSADIASNSHTSFKIDFAPTSRGRHRATVRIANTDADENPYDFAIEGYAYSARVDPPGFVLRRAVYSIKPKSAVTSSLDGNYVGSSAVGKKKTLKFEIHNGGGRDLYLTDQPPVKISGGTSGEFEVATSPGELVLQPRESTTFQIAFTPSAAGRRTAQVSIPNTDPALSDFSFEIGGDGLAVPAKGRAALIIVNALNGPSTNFEYQVKGKTNKRQETFTLTSATNGYVQKEFLDLEKGKYDITQTANGYAPENIFCVASKGSSATPDKWAGTVEVDLAEGETQICTFVNFQAATLKIVKKTIGGDGTFVFKKKYGEFPAQVSLTTSNGSAQRTLQNVYPMEIEFEETLPSGWQPSDMACQNTKSANYDKSKRWARVELAPGASATCTLTSRRTQDGGLKISKHIVGNTRDFHFDVTGSGLSNFMLRPRDGSTPASKSFNKLAPGQYTVTEKDYGPGYKVKSIRCPSGTAAIDLTARKVTIDIKAGDFAECIFTNEEIKKGTGEISIRKAVEGRGSNFNFTTVGAGLSNFTLSPAGGSYVTRSFKGLQAGTYRVTESAHADYQLDEIHCTGDTDRGNTVDLARRTVVIDLDAGEKQLCAFTNDELSSIEIVTTTKGGDATFSYTSSNSAFKNASHTTINGRAAKNFERLPGNNYTITQKVVPGWRLTDIQCTGTGTPATKNIPSRSVSFVLTHGGQVSCQFINEKTGSITIAKNVKGRGDRFSFSATGAGVSAFTLTPGRNATVSRRFAGLVQGHYTFTEARHASYQLSNLTCSGANNSIDRANRTVTINLGLGEDKTCTFTNSPLRLAAPPNPTGSLVVVKIVDGKGARFAFDGGGLGNFTLAPANDGTADRTFLDQPVGSYKLVEAAHAGYQLSGLVCNGDTNNNNQIDRAKRTVIVKLDAGETQTCTFTNTEQIGASIKIVKQTIGGDGTFQFTSTNPGFAPLTLSTQNKGASQERTGLAPGRYTITEAAAAGWRLKNIKCNTSAVSTDLSARSVRLDVTHNSKTTCTFTNVKAASITIAKTVNGAGAAFGFKAVGGGVGNFTLSPSDNGTARRQFSALAAGNYRFTEDRHAGYTLSKLTCTGGGHQIDRNARSVFVSLKAGENVICNFINSYIGSVSIKIRKFAVGGDDTFEYHASNKKFAPLSLRTSNGRGTATRTNLSPGRYAITEVLARGWKLTGIACRGVSATTDLKARSATFNAPANAKITCDFTSTSIRARTRAIIHRFMARRADMITSGGPEPDRMISRFESASASKRPKKPLVGFGGSGDNRRGHITFRASLPARDLGIDAWADGRVAYFKDDHERGHFGIVRGGADYLLTPRMLVGLMAQYDHAKLFSDRERYEISGHGWMAGPYAAMRLSEHLYLDGRATWGMSKNQVSPFLTYTDTFDTTRWLAAARLTGHWAVGQWSFMPSAEIIHFKETQHDYIDSNGLSIGSQSIALGRAIFGPKIVYRAAFADGTVLTPHASIKGIWDFKRPSSYSLDGKEVKARAGVQAQLEGGLSVRFPSKITLGVSSAYRGLYGSGRRAISAKAKLRIPLQ